MQSSEARQAAAAAASNALKITMQYRTKHRMVYELQHGAASLDVHVWTRVAEAPLSGWRVEAHNGRDADAVVIGKFGTTPTEALLEVGRAWGDGSSSLPRFDWPAVVALLTSVRAL
jgi:Tfp pilus assembly protein PilV